MRLERIWAVADRLRWLIGFFGIYLLLSIILILASFVVLYLIFVKPNDPDLGRAAGALIAGVLSPIIGMTLALVGMWFYENGYQNRKIG